MKWLFLVHQIQTPNSRERVKVWRLIKKAGAVLHRNSVYVLPFSKERLEDFQWVCQQIRDSQGEASVFVSEALDAKEDRLLRGLFQTSRQQEYAAVLQTSRTLLNRMIEARSKKRLTPSVLRDFEKEAAQIKESLQEILRIDFFSTSPPGQVQKIVDRIAKELECAPPGTGSGRPGRYRQEQFRYKVWTTRKDIHIDRICSAWLIRRFIDPSARFVFAAENRLPKDAVAFDVFGAEFSHHGEDCTFETLAKCFSLSGKGIKAIGEIIHDIDLKDNKFGRPEAAGLDAVIRALAGQIHDDHKLLDAGSIILDALFEHYSQRRGPS
jgi:hypothetical protein